MLSELLSSTSEVGTGTDITKWCCELWSVNKIESSAQRNIGGVLVERRWYFADTCCEWCEDFIYK